MTLAVSKLLHCRESAADGISVDTILASTGFLLLFPGFLAYHYGISVRWWGPALGGLFGGGAAALSALSACRLILQRGATRQPLGILHLMVLGILVYMVVWSLVGWLGISHSALVGQIMAEATATVLIWIAMLYIGASLTTCPLTLRRLSAIGIALALFCFGHAFYTGGFPAGPFLAFGSADESGQSTYQGVGRSLLAIGLMAAFTRRPGSATSLLILLGMGLLILSLGSRAHFFVLGVSVLVYLAVLVAIRRTRLIGLAKLFVTVAVIAAGASVFLDTRAAEIIDLASSASWQERRVAGARALEVIAEHPLAGLYGYHLWDSAGYAHNVLSAWTQYGLIGFVAFITTSACALYIAVAGFLVSRGGEPAWHLALHFNLVAIVLAIASEPVMSSVFPALAWGLTLRAQRAHRAAFAATRS
jgi:hypothetical protein